MGEGAGFEEAFCLISNLIWRLCIAQNGKVSPRHMERLLASIYLTGNIYLTEETLEFARTSATEALEFSDSQPEALKHCDSIG